jgi:hypothetical protein
MTLAASWRRSPSCQYPVHLLTGSRRLSTAMARLSPGAPARLPYSNFRFNEGPARIGLAHPAPESMRPAAVQSIAAAVSPASAVSPARIAATSWYRSNPHHTNPLDCHASVGGTWPIERRLSVLGARDGSLMPLRGCRFAAPPVSPSALARTGAPTQILSPPHIRSTTGLRLACVSPALAGRALGIPPSQFPRSLQVRLGSSRAGIVRHD